MRCRHGHRYPLVVGQALLHVHARGRRTGRHHVDLVIHHDRDGGRYGARLGVEHEGSADDSSRHQDGGTETSDDPRDGAGEAAPPGSTALVGGSVGRSGFGGWNFGLEKVPSNDQWFKDPAGAALWAMCTCLRVRRSSAESRHM